MSNFVYKSHNTLAMPDIYATPDEYDFSHDIDEWNDCTPIRKCLTLRLGGQSAHEIDLAALNIEFFARFAERAIAGDIDEIHMPGENTGLWTCQDGKLKVEIYDYGRLYDTMTFDLLADDQKYGKRLQSVVESIRVWQSLTDSFNYTIRMDYGENEYTGNAIAEEDVKRHITKRRNPKTREEVDVFWSDMAKRREDRKKPSEEDFRESTISFSSGALIDLVAIGAQDRMLMM